MSLVVTWWATTSSNHGGVPIRLEAAMRTVAHDTSAAFPTLLVNFSHAGMRNIYPGVDKSVFCKKMTWRVLLMTHQIIFLNCKLVVYGGFENVADLLFFKRETLFSLRLTSSIQFLPWEGLLIMKCHHFGSLRLHGCKSMLPLSMVNMRIFLLFLPWND